MKEIHKIAAMVIQDDAFLMVRKKGKDIWTNLGGKPEGNETEEEALIREIKEEMGCGTTIIKKLGDFRAPAIFDDAIVRLSVYLVELNGDVIFADSELEEYRYIPKNYRELGIQLPPSVYNHIIPFCIQAGLLRW